MFHCICHQEFACLPKKNTLYHFIRLEVCLAEVVLRVICFLSDVQEDELGLPAVPRASLRS
jgi:hypothetical protein